jgi:hypothetical protein
MKFLSFILLSFFSFLNVSGQDSSWALKKFDKEMIHFYKKGYLKNGNFYKLSDLKLEMKPGLPSYDFYKQYKKSENGKLIASLFAIGGTIMYFSALGNYNGYNESLFWTGLITTAVSLGFSIHFESRKIKFLTLAVKSRNREILIEK